MQILVLLTHREILWHEEEPVQRSSGDLQDLPQQDDQTVRVSQSGWGNIRSSCWSLHGGNRVNHHLRGREYVSEANFNGLLSSPLNSYRYMNMFASNLLLRKKICRNLQRKSTLTCSDLLQTLVSLAIWFTVDIFHNLICEEAKTDRRSVSGGFFSLIFQVFFFFCL